MTFVALRCSDIDACRSFYELAGLTFGAKHRHGSGPEHYACESLENVVFELYPKRKSDEPDRTAFGFTVSDVAKAASLLRSHGFDCLPLSETEPVFGFVFRDPDGRRVELTEEPQQGAIPID